MPKCPSCGSQVEPLEMFPGGLDLKCWAQSPEGRQMPTAEQLVAMWGGPVR